MTMSISERADQLEEQMAAELEAAMPVKSVLYTSGDRDPRDPQPYRSDKGEFAGKRFLMGRDRRLSEMPERPTLADFFRHRMSSPQHVMQSARLARTKGCSEKVVMACLLHDIGVHGFIRADHGYWAAQLVEPYVDEEVAWAIRYHQALRFFPDASVGYEYPELYIRLFGDAYEPEPYIKRAYEYARNHPWYMTSREITLNDYYSFDPTVQVEIDEFADIIERNFRQPAEGLGWDDTPSSHMWRTMNWPTRFL
jgi:hypothetical protein